MAQQCRRVQQRGRTSWRRRSRTADCGGQAPDRPLGRAPVALEHALRAIATSAAYDLLDEHGKLSLPMLWHYQAVDLVGAGASRRSQWPNGALGHHFTPVNLVVSNERLERAYSDEEEFVRPLAPALRRSLGALPLLVRLQYMNQCHAFNGAAAMALVRHAARHHLRYTVAGRPVREIGWAWGDCPDGTSLYVSQAGTERVKQQAHAHQVVALESADASASGHVLDLSVAQFGSEVALESLAALVEPSRGCAQSPTLARRSAVGLAPALFAERASDGSSAALPCVRVRRGQRAVEAALALVNERGHAKVHGYPLCAHVMPSEWFGMRDGPGPDDDLVEGGILLSFRKFEDALERSMHLSTSDHGGGSAR